MTFLTIQLGVAGFLLFLVGLLIGFAIPAVRNPRMGLSAHLTAAQTGPALIAISVFWGYLSVPANLAPILVYALIGSSYLLVLGIALASIFGASEALPIAGGKHRAGKLQETVVSLLVKGSSVVMALACLTIAYFTLTNIGTFQDL